MNLADLGIGFDAYGIATALKRNRLRVPANQRSYAWEADHVKVLFEDLSAAFRNSKSPYFLGTIVLTRGADDALEVADGQQRLATTSILISAVRDYLHQRDQHGKDTAAKYSSDYLLEYDPLTADSVPKLRLNAEDNEFFLRAILSTPDSPDRKGAASKPKWSSNERLRDAYELASEFVEKLIAPQGEKERIRLLVELVQFLEERVAVIVIKTTGQMDAYKMFQTLNDRGLKASQLDILKNFLFSQAAGRTAEVQPRWLSMVSKIESHDEELLLDYVRHFWISRTGPTREPELADRIMTVVSGERQALQVVMDLDTSASDYLALLTSLQAPNFAQYGPESRNEVYTVAALLRIEQIRPLMLAVLQNFEVAEARRAFSMFVSWSVRFLIAGGGGGGVLDRNYGLRAHEVTKKEITTAKHLAKAMEGIIPSDTVFRGAFERHKVTKAALARYYLRCLEHAKRNDEFPHLAEFEAPESQANLEHIMPETAEAAWRVPRELVDANYKRLGNMCLLGAKQNVAAGNLPFLEKRHLYKESPYLLAQDVALVETWGPAEIEGRQVELAKLAPIVWPI